MPLFRVHWANTDAEEGQWRTDTIGRFRERYFNNDGPTPYVWAENPDTLIWDLSFSNFVPRDGQGEGVHYLVLCDGDNWIELGNRFLGFGWSAYPHRGDASVFTAIHALEQFEVKVMPDPEQVRLADRAGRDPHALNRATRHPRAGRAQQHQRLHGLWPRARTCAARPPPSPREARRPEADRAGHPAAGWLLDHSRNGRSRHPGNTALSRTSHLITGRAARRSRCGS